MSERRIDRSQIIGVCGLALLSSAGHAAAARDDSLEEIVITATRQTDTVHTAPLTVTAISNEQIERQGIKLAEDLTTAVTALRISSANSGGAGGIGGSQQNGANIAIRGINSSANGAAATTGIYIDDVPLQQRQPLSSTGGGAAFPLLYDLARVEVLKGPQGTLYGGSSEGGTIRFITQQPSLTTSALHLSAENSYTKEGDTSYEFGASGSTPLDDGVALHGSAFYRRDGGYVDHVSLFTGNGLPGGQDTNSSTHIAFHADALFQIAPQGTVTVGVLYQNEKYADTDNFWANIPQYTQTGAGAGGVGVTTYTYGPYNQFGPYKSGASTNVGQNFYTSDAQISPVLTPHTQSMFLPSLTLDYAFDAVNFKSITSYNRTIDYSLANAGYTDIQGLGGSPLQNFYNGLPANSAFIANLPTYSSLIFFASTTKSFTQEFRLTSSDADSRLRWVTGAFFNRLTQNENSELDANFFDPGAAIGQGAIAPNSPVFPALIGNSTLEEKQYALFGEGTFKFTDALRATAGIRWTRDNFVYAQAQGGPLAGGPFAPNAAGDLTSNAYTPKFGLQYVQNDDINYYASATKGYRPGGINPLLNSNCAAAVATYKVNTSPFSDDSLWSYEVGSKIRAMGGRVSVNASAYYIDWKKVQTSLNIGCPTVYTVNGDKAVSKGIDFEGSLLIVDGLTATLRSAYTNAKYVGTVGGGGGTTPFVQTGNELPYTPKYQSDLSVEYHFNLPNGSSAFVRADGSYQSSVAQDSGPGTVGWNPDNYLLPSAKEFGLRAGYLFKKVEVSMFVRNLTNSQDLLYRGGFAHGPGRSGCLNASCSAFQYNAYGATESTYRPRTIGVGFSYRD